MECPMTANRHNAPPPHQPPHALHTHQNLTSQPRFLAPLNPAISLSPPPTLSTDIPPDTSTHHQPNLLSIITKQPTPYTTATHRIRHAHHDKLSCSPCLNPKLAVNPHELGKSLWSEPVSICGGSGYRHCTKKRQSGLTRFVITNPSMDNFPPIETLPLAPQSHS
jgi:hypothetical protein